ncbi:MAG: hypothetical protein J6K02_05855 [Alistipes sp.]|uniref:hypothetical protein n=2 Tax=Alistipes TaxID=239759 RepID=UPI001B6F2507|nr:MULTISPECIES: hypothetical protein [Alistipes]MBP3528183.1 hypothetical protein [Alistipes sp.]
MRFGKTSRPPESVVTTPKVRKSRIVANPNRMRFGKTSRPPESVVTTPKVRKSRIVANPNRMRFGKTPEGKKGPAVTYSMKNQKAVTQRSAAGPYGRAGAFEKERRRPQDTHTHVKVD